MSQPRPPPIKRRVGQPRKKTKSQRPKSSISRRSTSSPPQSTASTFRPQTPINRSGEECSPGTTRLFRLQHRDPGKPLYDMPSSDSDPDDELPRRGRRYLTGSRRMGEDNSGWFRRIAVKTEDALVRFFENEVRCTAVGCATLTDVH
jgi:hypothetical protein